VFQIGIKIPGKWVSIHLTYVSIVLMVFVDTHCCIAADIGQQ